MNGMVQRINQKKLRIMKPIRGNVMNKVFPAGRDEDPTIWYRYNMRAFPFPTFAYGLWTPLASMMQLTARQADSYLLFPYRQSPVF